jgi:hypothetical protein
LCTRYPYIEADLAPVDSGASAVTKLLGSA